MRAASWIGLGLFIAGLPLGARAQTDPDLLLLADQNGAPPNVMILFDTSGSMRHAAWHEDFNPRIFQDAGSPCSATVYKKSGSNGQCPGSGDGSNRCPDNDTGSTLFGDPIPGLDAGDTITCTRSAFVADCGDIPAIFNCSTPSSSSLQIRLPDLDGTDDIDPSDGTVIDEPNESTYWSPNYIHWFMKQLANTGKFPTDFPLETRKMAAKRVLKDIVEELNPTKLDGTVDQRIRFGLARMHTTDGSLTASSNGGYVVEPIADNNKSQILATLRSSKISAPPYARTPLSETLIDVARYFVGGYTNPGGSTGLGSYSKYNRNTTSGGSTSSPPASPLDPAVLCRLNYIIVVTDGAPTDDANNHHGSAFSSTFGSDFDGDGDSNNSADDNDTLDDVAAYLFQRDLVADSVMPGVQNIVTYTIGFSLDLPLLRDTATNGDGRYFTGDTADQLGEQLRAALEDIQLRNGSFTAAAVPGSQSAFGQGFYTAYFEPRPRGDLFRGHLQAYRLTSTFDVEGTDGASAIDPATGEFYEPRTTYFWDAAETLADPNNARNLFYTPTPLSDPNGFTQANIQAADLGLTAADIGDFPQRTAVPFSNIEDVADAIVGYVRGEDGFDEDGDGNISERRSTVLGDIFHSNPVVIGPPGVFLAGEDGYGPLNDPNSFIGTHATRDKVIYAGANDGMLHAFNAGMYKVGDDPSTTTITETGYYDLGTGIEYFGWVPGVVLPSLPSLKRLEPKPFFVDGQVTVADGWLPSGPSDVTKQTSEWTTALVVGMRNGGEGYLALDITKPGATTGPHGPYPKFLWEFADPAEPLGKTWSTAVIARVKLAGSYGDDYCGPSDGDGAALPAVLGDCREEWVAIFGGGYLEQGDPNALSFLNDPTDPTWVPDSKSIFMVSLASGQVLARASFDALDPKLSEMKFSFPSDPAVLDLDFDGYADVIYIGDTGGQLWKWDISAVASVDPGTGRVPLASWPVGRYFTAPVAGNGHYRSFFYSPAAAYVDGELVLSIGTGERTALSYASTAGVDENHYYVMKDETPTGAGSIPATPFDLTDLTLLNGNAADSNTSDLGFYLVGDANEKFVSDSLALGGFLITASFVPELGTPVSLCTQRGDAILYIFSLQDGSGFFVDPSNPDPDVARRMRIGSGLPASPRVVTSGDKTQVVIQTSAGQLSMEVGPETNIKPVDLVFWEHEF